MKRLAYFVEFRPFFELGASAIRVKVCSLYSVTCLMDLEAYMLRFVDVRVHLAFERRPL